MLLTMTKKMKKMSPAFILGLAILGIAGFLFAWPLLLTAAEAEKQAPQIRHENHLVVLPAGYAEDLNHSSSSTTPPHDQGYEISKDNYLNVPSDMKIQKVANNVITTEPDVTYLARKFEEQNQRLAEIQNRLASIEGRLQTVESAREKKSNAPQK